MKPINRSSTAVGAFALGSGGFVHAQTTQTGMHKIDNDSVIVQPFRASVHDVEKMEICTTGGEELGEVENVLVDGSDTPVAVSVDIGGCLGMGQKRVVIGLDQLTKAGDRLTVAMTKEQIQALSEFAQDG